jgi:hypothetical protein
MRGIAVLFHTPAKTVHGKVDKQLLDYAKRVKKFG